MATSDLYEMRFEWPHRSPNNVFVTGTFDEWTRSVKLTKTDTGFIGVVRVPWAEKILYKFVVDGEWICQAGQPTETDPAGFVNNVYFTPPKPLSIPKPVELIQESTPAPTLVIPEPTAEVNEAPVISRKPIVIVPLNAAEHTTVGTTASSFPAVPDFVLPPPPRARSASPPPTRDARRPLELAPEQLNEVKSTPEPAVVPTPEVPVEEQKQEAESHIPVDNNLTATEAKVEEPVKKVQEREEKVIIPEPEPTKVETPTPAKVESKPAPATLPTPPATPSKKFPLSGSPASSPSSSRFGTPSRKKRLSIFGKLKDIFKGDKKKDKDTVKT